MKILYAGLGIAIGLVFLVSGAAAQNAKPSTAKPSPSAAKPAPNQQSARIYFIRQKAFYGSWANPDVKIDGQVVGTMKSGSYVQVERAAGPRKLSIGLPVALGFYEADVHFDAGKTYYFEIGPAHSASGGVLLPVLAGNVGKPLPGRSFNSGWQLNTLDAATGIAEIGKLKGNSR